MTARKTALLLQEGCSSQKCLLYALALINGPPIRFCSSAIAIFTSGSAGKGSLGSGFGASGLLNSARQKRGDRFNIRRSKSLETPDTRTHTYTHKHTRTRTRAHANTRAIPGSASNLGDCARFLGGGAYSWCCCGCC